MPRKQDHLVVEHLESISAGVFEDFRTVITEIVDRKNGIYALYDGDKLYYVGLARNLKSRLRTHLKDRHKGLWDRFSVYLTNGDSHMKELESLVLRVVKTEGNRVKGKLKGSKDKRRDLERRIKEEQDVRRFGILGKVKKERVERPMRRAAKNGPQWHAAAGFLALRALYKGKTYKATLHKDGTVRSNGKDFTSLSAAGKAVTKRSTNGRSFWRVRDREGTWVRLKTLGTM